MLQPVVPTTGKPNGGAVKPKIVPEPAVIANNPERAREIAYFRANIAKADTPEKLIADPVLLKVTLTAFGLSGASDNKSLLRNVLAEGTTPVAGRPRPLALSLSDPGFRDMAAAFGYGDKKGAQVKVKGFADDVVARYAEALTSSARSPGGPRSTATYQPVIPTGGLSGWRYLERTAEEQQARFAESGVTARDLDYFAANIAKADTAEKLVADRVLLKVALGAYGLSSEASKKAFVQKVLAEGTTVVQGEPRPFATRLGDPKYREMAAAFGYGDAKGAQVKVKGFADTVMERYRVRAFEEAVGAVDNSMRLAMNFAREMPRIAGAGVANETAWLRVVGDVPLRSVFERAFSLPDQFGSLDVDRQVQILQERAQQVTKSSDFKAFADPANRDAMLRRFFVQEQVAAGPSGSTPGLAALSILRGGQSSTANLLISRL